MCLSDSKRAFWFGAGKEGRVWGTGAMGLRGRERMAVGAIEGSDDVADAAMHHSDPMRTGGCQLLGGLLSLRKQGHLSCREGLPQGRSPSRGGPSSE